MENRRSNLVGGMALILLGLGFLLWRLAPELFRDWLQWPSLLIAGGGLLLLAAVLVQEGGLAVPGVILLGIGLILHVQNPVGDWTSWTSIWSLIPGFIGVGILLSGIIDRSLREHLLAGLILIGVSVAGFLFFGGTFNLRLNFVEFWPVILIVLGVIALAQAMIRP